MQKASFGVIDHQQSCLIQQFPPNNHNNVSNSLSLQLLSGNIE